MFRRLTSLFLVCSLSALSADVVEIHDGSRLVGTITGIYGEVLTLETSYAGTLKIDTAEVATYSTDNPVFVRLENRRIVSGSIQSAEDRGIRIQNEEKTVSASPDDVTAVWTPDQRDPELLEREQELLELRRKWAFQVSTELNGSGGNTDETTLALRGVATLEGPKDTLRFNGRFRRNKRDGTISSNEKLGGIRYDAFPKGNLGWFARTELENDPFKNLDLRSTGGGGLSYRILNRDDHSLVTRFGGAFRNQNFTDGTTSNQSTLDLSLSHSYTHRDFWTVTTELNLNPSIPDVSDFLLVHTSTLEIPLPEKFWSLGLGVSNDFDNEPSPGVQSWDYSWFASINLNFN